MTETNAITIRRFEGGDAPAVSRLIVDNLLLVNSRDYGQAAVQQLARFYTPELLREYAGREEVFVALEGAQIVGTAALDQDRVRNVFVRMDQHKRGVGRALMRTLEEVARRCGQTHLALHASLAAVDFYRKLGYQPVEEIEESLGEESIKMVIMEKRFFPDD